MALNTTNHNSGGDRSEGSPQRINEPPWVRCLQGAVDARWVVIVVDVVVCCFVVLLSSSPRGIWTNRAEARGQLVLPPFRLPELLRNSRLLHLAANFS